MYRGPIHSGVPTTQKHLTLVVVTVPLFIPPPCSISMYNLTFCNTFPIPLWGLGDRLQYHWQRRPVVNYRKALLLWGCRLAVAVERVENSVITLFKNGFHLHSNAQMLTKALVAAGAPPHISKNSERRNENVFCACQSGTPSCKWWYNAIQTWVPFTLKCSLKRWWLGPWRSDTSSWKWCY